MRALIAAITEAGGPLLRSVRLFDVYKPSAASTDMVAGERSMAVRLELLDDEVTLTDERIEPVINAVVEALRMKLNARLRG